MRPIRSAVLLTPIWAAALCLMAALPALAQVDACQPPGLSDEEAERIIALAEARGASFRQEIDALRASGLSYETDTAYNDLMADPERAIALAKERIFGRERDRYTYSSLISMSKYTEDEYVEARLRNWVAKKNYNYFTIALTDHLQRFALDLGGTPTESPYQFELDTRTFVFALGRFTDAAKLRNLNGSAKPGGQFARLNYTFAEKRFISEGRPNYQIRLFLTSNNDGTDVTLAYVGFHGVDPLKNSWPIFRSTVEGCLPTLPVPGD